VKGFTKLVMVGGLLLWVLLSGVGALAADSDTLTIAIRNWDYDTIDPHISVFTQSWWMINCFTDTLVAMGPDGSIYPSLASSWTVSDDARAWVFQLRAGVTFHDGTPWNAQALIDNFNRVLDPATKSLWFIDKIRDIESMEILSPLSVRISFKTPKPGFLTTISQPGTGFISPTAFNNAANIKSQDKFKGTGPFMLVTEVYQQRVTMKRNPNYAWAPSFMAHEGPANIENLVWRFIPEDETRLAALQSGEVDVIDEVPPAETANVEADPAFALARYGRPGISQMYHLNAQLAPTNELAVRQAINYAINQVVISNTIFNGDRPPAYGLLMPNSPYYNSAVESMYPYDPQKAKDLLDAAGWVDPTGSGTGTREKDGKLLIINFVTYPGFVAEAPAEMAQAMLRKVGIQMNITVLTGSAMMEQAGKVGSIYNSCVCGDTSVDSAMELFYFCDSEMIGVYNFAHYTSPEIDALIDIATQTLDESKKSQAIFDVQRIWMELALGKPTLADNMIWGTVGTLKGFGFRIDGTPSFYDASL
jgi:peptide/nickel transport system substrate-binding protein